MYSFQYNGYTLQNDSNTSINKVEGLSRIPMRISEDPLTGGHGGNIWERRYDMRPITIGGYIYADDFTTYYQKRNLLLLAFQISSLSNTLIITRPDGVQRSITAKVIDIPLYNETEGEFCSCQFEIVLKCENPYWLSASTISYYCGTTATGGFPISATIPMPLGSLSGNSIQIINNGDVAGKAVFKIANSVINPTVTNMTTGQFMKVTYTLVDGEYIMIYRDQTGQYVTKNTGASLYSYFTGSIFDIAVGTNIIVFSASAYSATAVLQIDFTEKYLQF